jgi:FOG: WD40-like repeat
VATDGGAPGSNDANATLPRDTKTLSARDWFSPGPTPFTASPVAFNYNGKDLIVAANADGRLYVLDTGSLGGVDHRTPLAKTAAYSAGPGDFMAGALATSENADGSRWVFAAAAGPPGQGTGFGSTNGPVTNGAIVAYKLVDQNGTMGLQAVWASRDMLSPAPADRRQRRRVRDLDRRISDPATRNSPRRSEHSAARRLSLWALDAASGKELWSSGNTISSFVRGVGPSAGDGQVYVVTYDGTVYAFGIPLEH